MSKRILVVEDHEDNRQIIRDLLSTTDYEITEAEIGEAALAVVAIKRRDLILMDIQLPVMDGYEAARRIKADPRCGRSRSLRSPPMRLVGKNKRRGQWAAMNTWQNHIARANCWQKFVSTCPRLASLKFAERGYRRDQVVERRSVAHDR